MTFRMEDIVSLSGIGAIYVEGVVAGICCAFGEPVISLLGLTAVDAVISRPWIKPRATQNPLNCCDKVGVLLIGTTVSAEPAITIPIICSISPSGPIGDSLTDSLRLPQPEQRRALELSEQPAL